MTRPFVLAAGISAFIAFAAAPGPAAAQLTFVEIAREFDGGLFWLDPEAPPALAEDGTVVFAGTASSDFDDDRLFAGDGGPLTVIDIADAGLLNVTSVDVNDAGQIAFVAQREAAAATYRGVYTTSTSGAAIATLYEGRQFVSPSDDEPTPVQYNAALSSNGTVAFSAIINGFGALYRNPFAGPLEVLREGTGTFYNTMRLDVNDAGQVAVQMEYSHPSGGLRRGILVFDAPGQALAEVDTALEFTPVSVQPQPAINAAGQVAFALNTSATIVFFDPPGNASGDVVATVTLEPGVYLVTPTDFGTLKSPELIASTADGYSSFGRVDVNDLGEVAFEASVDDSFGVFVGPDPVADKVLATGDVRGDQLYSWLRLGEINNAGEISLMTSDFYSTDRQVWRVEGAFVDDSEEEPPPPSPSDRLRALLRWLLRLIFGRGA